MEFTIEIHNYLKGPRGVQIRIIHNINRRQQQKPYPTR